MGFGELCCIFTSDTKAAFKTTKWFYFGVLIWSSVLTWILRDYSDDLLEKLPRLDACDKFEPAGKSACYGKGAVLRVSFATAVFFAAHFLVLIKCKHESDERCLIHTSCPALKLVIWIALVVISFTIPHGFYEAYGEIARVSSGLFLVFQAMLLIELAYALNEKLLTKERYQWVLVLLTLLAYGLAFVIIGFTYHYYAPRASCSTNISWITWTLIFGIIVSAASLSNWRPENAGLFSSSVVFLYCCFVLALALNNLPSGSECQTAGGMSSGWMKVASFLVALLAVVLSAMTTGIAKFFDSGDSDEDELPYRPDFFHFVFVLASMYLAMLFTNWSLKGTAEETTLDSGKDSAWIKIASQWFVYLLYFWTMIAPKVLKNRVFS